MYIEAETLSSRTYCESCFACLTAYLAYLCMETHYEKVYGCTCLVYRINTRGLYLLYYKQRKGKCQKKKKKKKKPNPRGLSMPALQYNVFIHDVGKLISLKSQLLMTKGGWGGGGVSCSSSCISLKSQLLMTKGGWGVLLLIAHCM